jgi:hypothetical protein
MICSSASLPSLPNCQEMSVFGTCLVWRSAYFRKDVGFCDNSSAICVSAERNLPNSAFYQWPSEIQATLLSLVNLLESVYSISVWAVTYIAKVYNLVWFTGNPQAEISNLSSRSTMSYHMLSIIFILFFVKCNYCKVIDQGKV